VINVSKIRRGRQPPRKSYSEKRDDLIYHAFPSPSAFFEEYKEDFEDNVDNEVEWRVNTGMSEEDALEDYRTEIIGQYNYLTDKFASFPDVFPIYRAIYLEDISKFDCENVGIFWSWDEDSAESHWGLGGGDPYLLTGIIDKSEVDWQTTLLNNIGFTEEDEIRVKTGRTPILITKIDRNGDRVLEDQLPMRCYAGEWQRRG
jgi:hypothetical protein